MSDPILESFIRDIELASKQLDLIDSLQRLSAADAEEIEDSNTPFFQASLKTHELSKIAHGFSPKLLGSIFLYLIGRFEEFVITEFQDLCQRLVQKAEIFEDLPKKMRENLIIFTALVMQSPRKYGHADGGVRTFVATLAENMKPGNQVNNVNIQCLSITESNMRADMLDELFSRVSAKNIWTKLGQQSVLQVNFENADPQYVEKQAKKSLDEAIDKRNKYAHPSDSTEWPSLQTLRETLLLLSSLSKAISSIIPVYEIQLTHTSES